jgi:hypothetical protein
VEKMRGGEKQPGISGSCFASLLARAGIPFVALGRSHLQSCGGLNELRKRESYFREGWGGAVCLGTFFSASTSRELSISSSFSTALFPPPHPHHKGTNEIPKSRLLLSSYF